MNDTKRLAIDGGAPVRATPLPIGKGVDLVDDEEIAAVTAVPVSYTHLTLPTNREV